jgi:hypothetical protein
MNAKEAVKIALTSTQYLLNRYVSDLSDADILVRPVPNANHIAWQLGQLIWAEAEMMKAELPTAAFPELPAGFKKQHDKDTAAMEPPKGFRTKHEYMDLFGKVRGATIAALDQISDADLDKPTSGPMAKYAPKLADMLQMQANHVMMHAGQFTVVRRKLGKPVLF